MYIKTGRGVYSKYNHIQRKKNVRKHIALLWQGKYTQYNRLQGSGVGRGARTKLERPGQSSEAKCLK